MAELFVQIAVSLDGYIEDANKDIDWMEFDPSFDPVATATLRSIDGMIFGRRAYELLRQFWPTAGETPGASADLIEQAQLMNGLPKYVLTHGMETADWANSRDIRIGELTTLKSRARRPLALFAGAGAARSALEHGVVDELRLVQQPVILGGGTPLFARDGERRNLTLVESRAFASGAVMNRYRVTR